ncbi:hypothetical protein YC2023_018256 [Brassica napus]
MEEASLGGIHEEENGGSNMLAQLCCCCREKRRRRRSKGHLTNCNEDNNDCGGGKFESNIDNRLEISRIIYDQMNQRDELFPEVFGGFVSKINDNLPPSLTKGT